MPKALKCQKRWVVVCERYSESVGDWVRDEFPILYGLESEANGMRDMLQAGSDKSYFDPDETDKYLFVEQIDVYF